jgi:COP9 signalosome complex subunit 3
MSSKTILVSQVCRKYAQVAIEANQALKAIKPLRCALNRLRFNSETLTPVHADYLQVCLVAKFYSAALPVLEEEIFDVNPEVSSSTPKDLLLYSYYGGMVYTGLKEYKKALTYFKTVRNTIIFTFR